jgi:cardiolipin synthase
VQKLYIGVEELMRKRFSLFTIIICLFLTGCSLDIKSLFVKEEAPTISNLSTESLYFDGQKAREKTKELISSAQESIYIEQKIFSDPDLKELIISKASSGVQIKILLDQFQTPNKSTLSEFKSNNISVQYYPAQKGQTNEVKILVVDLKEAMVYSFPWTEEGFASHNLAVNVTGRSAYKLATVFNKDWVFTTTLSLDIPKNSDLEEDNIIVATDANVKNQLLNQIKKSTNSIWLTASHITDQDIAQAIIERAIME